MADLDDPDLSVLNRRVTLAMQAGNALGDLPSLDSPTKSVIGSELDEDEQTGGGITEEGDSTELMGTGKGNGLGKGSWQRRQTMVPLSRSIGSEDRTALPFTPKPSKTLPSRPSAAFRPLPLQANQNPDHSVTFPEVPPPSDPLSSLPSMGESDDTRERSYSSLPGDEGVQAAQGIRAEGDVSQRAMPHHPLTGRNSSPSFAMQVNKHSPPPNDASSENENGDLPSPGSGVYASTPFDAGRRMYRHISPSATPSSSAGSPTSAPSASSVTGPKGTGPFPPSAMKSSIRSLSGTYGSRHPQIIRSQRKISVSFDVPAISRTSWEGSDSDTGISEDRWVRRDSDRSEGAMELLQDPSVEQVEGGAAAVKGAESEMLRSPEEGHAASTADLSADGEELGDEPDSPPDVSEEPRAGEVAMSDQGSLSDRESDDRRSADGTEGYGMRNERAIDIMVPLKDEDGEESGHASNESSVPARDGRWVDDKPRHRFTSHPPASPYPLTPRHVRQDGNTTTTPVGPVPSNRIPSLSRSSDHSGSGSLSGSEASFERDHPTPGLPQGEFATPVREARTGGTQYAARTPGGVSFHSQLDGSEEGGSGEEPVHVATRAGEVSATAKDVSHHTLSTQYSTPGQGRHLSRETSERRLSLLLGEDTDQDGTPVKGRRPEYSFGKDQHARAVLGDMTGVANPIAAPSPSGLGSGVLVHMTPKADTQSAMSRHLLATLNASAMKPSRRTGTLSRIGGRARRNRLSSAGTISSSEERSKPDISSPESRAFGEGSIAGFQTSRFGLQFGDEGGSSAGDVSLVSITSSADLTTDQRASSARARGNTSVPAVMPSDANLPDAPVNAKKLVKHMFGMNAALTIDIETLTDALNKERALSGKGPWEGRHRADPNSLDVPDYELSPGGSTASHASFARSDAAVDLVSELRGVNEELEMACAAKDAELEAQTVQIASQADERKHIEELSEKLKAFEQMDDDHLADLDVLKEALEEKDSIILAKEAAIEQMQQAFSDRLTGHSAEFGKLMEEEKSRFEEQLKQRVAQLQEAQWAVAALESEKERLRVIMDTDTLDEKEQVLKLQLQDIEGQLADREEANMRLRRDLNEQHQQTAARNQDVERLNQDLQKVAGSLWDAQIKLQQAERSEDAVRADLHATTSALRQAKEDEIAIKAKLQTSDAQTLVLIARTGELHGETASWQSERSDLGNQLTSLKEEISVQTAQVQSLSGQLADAEARANDPASKRRSQATSPFSAEIHDLQEQLAAMRDRSIAAEQEASRSSPASHHKLAMEAHILRIDDLVQENKALAERVRTLQVQSASAIPPAGSPFKTPFVDKRLLRLQDPKTPGSIPDASWMDTSLGYEAVAISPDQVAHLMEELKTANQRLDGDIQTLGDANLVVYSLAERLAHAEEQKAELECRLQQHDATESDLRGRLSRLTCPECKAKVDANVAQLTSGNDQRSPLISKTRSDRAIQDLKQVITEIRKRHEALQADAATVRRDMQQRISGLEAKLRAANAVIRNAVEEEQASNTLKDQLRREVQRLTSDLRLKSSAYERQHENTTNAERAEENARLAKEAASRQLSGSLQAERDSRRKIEQLEQQIASMRSGRVSSAQSETVAEVATLRIQLSRLNEQLMKAKAELRESESSRKALSSTVQARAIEVQQARTAASTRTDELKIACADLRRVEAALHTTQRDAVRLQSSVEAIEKEQGSVREFKDELTALRRGRRDAEGLIASLEADLADKECSMQQQILVAKESMAALSSRNDHATSHMRIESLVVDRRKLTAQVRYLNARCAREHTFRRAMQGQKDYLMCLVGKFKQTERDTLAAIASMGFPANTDSPRAKPSLKGAAMAVRATIRMRRLAAKWRETEDGRP